jgi:threonyl-tRNA synthetase
LIPIRDEQVSFAKEVKEILQRKGFRVIMDARNETLDKRIREGSLKKIPYIVIIGEKETTQRTVAVRQRGAGNVGVLPLEEFINKLSQEQQQKSL